MLTDTPDSTEEMDCQSAQLVLPYCYCQYIGYMTNSSVMYCM